MTKYILSVPSSAEGLLQAAYLPNAAGFFYNQADGNLYVVGQDNIARKAFTAETGFNLDLNTTSDNKPVRINSRSYTQASGDSIGFQTKPSQTVTTTGNVVGAEFSPRTQAAIGAASVIALRADPILKGTTGNLSANLIGIESNLDAGDPAATRTITGKVCFARIFPNLPAGMTYTGKKSVVVFAAPNTGNWDYLFDIETGNATWVVAPGNTSALTNMGYFKVRIGSTDYRVPILEDE